MKSEKWGTMGLCLLVAMIFLSTWGWSADFPDLSTKELKNKIDAKEQFLLVNSLSDIEFDMVHIPGSVNIPAGEIPTTDKLPQNKETPIVFY